MSFLKTMQFCISVKLLGLPDDKYEEKPSFLQFKKKKNSDRLTDQRTDRWTDRPSYGDARTHLKKEKDEKKVLLNLAHLRRMPNPPALQNPNPHCSKMSTYNIKHPQQKIIAASSRLNRPASKITDSRVKEARPI